MPAVKSNKKNAKSKKETAPITINDKNSKPNSKQGTKSPTKTSASNSFINISTQDKKSNLPRSAEQKKSGSKTRASMNNKNFVSAVPGKVVT